jgi:PTH1 family peptidyl-tRNA hydrolase
MSDESRWLVVGLGNPGAEYEHTRHNAGFFVADLLATRMGCRFKAHKSRALVAQGRLADLPLVVAKPTSYMNDSGGPVTSVAHFFKTPPDRIIAIHDELDLEFGQLRVKLGGGDNGHNGLKSMRASLGTGEFYRVRFGIGRPPGRLAPADFVLRDFAPAERKELSVLVDNSADAVEVLLRDGLERAQNAFNN